MLKSPIETISEVPVMGDNCTCWRQYGVGPTTAERVIKSLAERGYVVCFIDAEYKDTCPHCGHHLAVMKNNGGS